jgi:hypothetical protein
MASTNEINKNEVMIRFDEWIENIVKDPAQHEPLKVLVGYMILILMLVLS